MLVLEIELLTGAYRAALPDGSGAEWPPHPERVLSALAQALGDGGQRSEERAAIEWLEAQDPPFIEADAAPPERDAPVVYVPPNDQRGDELAVLPERRPRQARTFRAALPADPRVRMLWQAQPSRAVRGALDTLAGRVASLGHSSSFVRFAFGEGEQLDRRRAWVPDPEGSAALRAPHPGRLAALDRWLTAGERPRTGRSVWFRTPGDDPALVPKSALGGHRDWFVFEGSGGFQPDLLGFAHVAARARAALMSLGPQPTPEVISGHDTEGGPTRTPHLAIVPLADVGWDHARGDLLGFAAVLPRDIAGPSREAALAALAALAHLDGKGEPGQLGRAELHLSRDRVWILERAPAPSRSSLRPDRYCRAARTWASATPVLLDRYADDNDPGEEAAILAAACRNIGLPEPEAIEIHKHSALRGAPSAYPARGDAKRPDWSFPGGSKAQRRPRRHVVIHFAEAVRGPVILGAGRFQGFGLCLPVGGREERR